MFKRSASRAGLKEALALRSERKIERLREIERFEKESKPTRGSSTNSYFGSDRDRASPEVTRELAGVHYALWEVKEEAFIRSMAAKVLQHRWRLIRCSLVPTRPVPLSVCMSVPCQLLCCSFCIVIIYISYSCCGHSGPSLVLNS